MKTWLKKYWWTILLVLALMAASWAGGVRQARATTAAQKSLRGVLTYTSPVTYTDDQGNTIVYYALRTHYGENEPEIPDGLDTQAIHTVFDTAAADTERACTVNGMPAALYTQNGRAYLCWTKSPEFSFVLEYDPAVEAEEEIFKMAESVE